ncbi:uncharacterized protein I303_106246 [Kwoniella dejecticola CBS 10117]|uniref:RIC1 C-terminal alpha solenoid region domain-containing protein n=1 Tax=Kwoniella dejecticola CBS 10117 TaxID=1296121 RepID=A0A1A6A1N7_9TREE|nr:uncharacterized protein I303_06265 [Kwoniella dejecticola CBS 10117]OBR83978.1 hypothetical protein I303_06265 [Kwoniella dejecticola CBS 10117]
MYWPTATTRLVNTPAPLQDAPIRRLKSSRKGNFFVSLTENGLGVWDVRPTVLQAAVVRSQASIERFGVNVDVFWAHDGRGIIVLTNTSHLLFYQLVPTSRPSYDSPGPSTPGPGEGDVVMGWELRCLGTAFLMGRCESLVAQPHNLLLVLQHPPSLLSVPHPVPSQLLSPAGSHFPPPPLDGDSESQMDCSIYDLSSNNDWLKDPLPIGITSFRLPGLPILYTLLNQDGRLYVMYQSAQLAQMTPSESLKSQLINGPNYTGIRIHPPPKTNDLTKRVEALGLMRDEEDEGDVEDYAEQVAVNPRFGLVAVGLASGKINIISLPPYPAQPKVSHTLDLRMSANLHASPGGVTSLAWTGDGYCLAAGYEKGWAAWSMGGRLGGCGVKEEEDHGRDDCPAGVVDVFWAPGNLELFLLRPGMDSGPQIEVVSFVKSASTSQQSPDNTRYAFLQMDDRVLVYRGADQPDMSVINPESDVWQSIKIPSAYIATNWPLRYASMSSDGKLIAVAGRKGLTHYSASSGRWKLFPEERQEREFSVRGGLLWFHHVLIAAVDVDKTHQIRLYSRDLDLTEILHTQTLPSPVLVMTLLDNSLLVYTADNNLYHFLILPTQTSIKLHLCGSISFRGIVQVPSRVRGMSWLIPPAQKELGDPVDDLIVATIIFLVDGKLVLLRPRRARTDEVRYDMQILADRIEVYWTHLHGVATLENSLWGYDGQNVRVWLDALTIEATRVNSTSDSYEEVEESVKLRLDFYPLSILMDKAIIIGVDPDSSLRLPWPINKISTSTHLFLPQFLRYHLSSTPQQNLLNALILARHYDGLVYFAHSLEILLHSVLEDEAAKSSSSSSISSLPQMTQNSSAKQGENVIDLNSFPPTPNPGTSSPREDVNVLSAVIQFLDHFDNSLEVVVGCARKTEVDRWKLLFDVVGSPRTLFEACLEQGKLRTAASYLLVLHGLNEDGGVAGFESEEGGKMDVDDTIRLLRQAIKAKEFHLCKELLRFLHSIDESGKSLVSAIEQVGILDNGSTTMTANTNNLSTDRTDSGRPDIIDLTQAEATDEASKATQNTPQIVLSPEVSSPAQVVTPSPSSSMSPSQSRSSERVNSPFQLSQDRMYKTPPSPRTMERFEGEPPAEIGQDIAKSDEHLEN